MEYQPANRISMRQHPELTEKWLQAIIADDPSVLGLGELAVKDVERQQPRAGRLDVLLSDPETLTRYEVEIQLGATDESHIIRTIEYWDLERRRFPQYEHVAVIVAEEITGRFLNVISLFSGSIPLIAIQIQAIEVQGILTLVATRVVDVVELATEEEDEAGGITDRNYWETGRGSPLSLDLADRVLELIRERTGALVNLKYNKNYVGLAKDGIASNFVVFHPRKQHLIAAFRIARSDELTEQLAGSGIDLMGYGTRGGRYRLRLTGVDLEQQRELLGELAEKAAESYGRQGGPPAASDTGS